LLLLSKVDLVPMTQHEAEWYFRKREGLRGKVVYDGVRPLHDMLQTETAVQVDLEAL
jgi:hypothetical protein